MLRSRAYCIYVCMLAYVIRARGASPHGAGAARTAQTSSLRLSAREQQRSEEALLQTMRRYGDGSFRNLVKCITLSIENIRWI